MKRNDYARIVFIVSGFSNSKSRNSYQRAKFLVENFQTIFITSYSSANSTIKGAEKYFNIKPNLFRPLRFAMFTALP